ncbi:hypothetical protein RchiOBHm_Chr2g0097381 [Rosa chinensis]|uniref:Uncharacterized protein n=1 Tax=Rosa chinensis TaxID=74649 RepID=A0A2P6RLC1_ROSCH|nr:hypothetical protein RchiOBHm_Chr2g0097381 [Rosa chinensis]
MAFKAQVCGSAWKRGIHVLHIFLLNLFVYFFLDQIIEFIWSNKNLSVDIMAVISLY